MFSCSLGRTAAAGGVVYAAVVGYLCAVLLSVSALAQPAVMYEEFSYDSGTVLLVCSATRVQMMALTRATVTYCASMLWLCTRSDTGVER